MPDDLIVVDAYVTKLASARKRRDGLLETVVTLTVGLVNPTDETVAALIAIQGREAVRATFAVLQPELTFRVVETPQPEDGPAARPRRGAAS